MGQHRSDTLDLIRGLAILLVLSFHYFPNKITNIGWTGVQLFFILSGFLIGGVLIDNKNSGNYYLTFYIRRVFRIVPLYAFDIVLFATIVGLDQPFWRYASFTQNFAWMTHGSVPPWMAPTWSLAVEEQFYLLLPLLIRRIEFRRLPCVAAAFVLMAPAYRLFMTQCLGSDWPAAHQTLPGSLDSLFLGVLIAWAVRTPAALSWLMQRRHALWTMAGIGLAGMAALFSDPPDPTSWLGSLSLSWIALTYAIVFAGLVTPPAPAAARRGPLCWLGVGAYSLYLFHIPVVLGLEQVFSSPAVAHLFAVPAVLALAVACWYGIERPLISTARRRWGYQPRAAAARQTVTASPLALSPEAAAKTV